MFGGGESARIQHITTDCIAGMQRSLSLPALQKIKKVTVPSVWGR
jgi:hypothetical protein